MSAETVRAGAWLRHLVPPSGKRYHLFDSSVLLIGVSLLWYITTEPSKTTVQALDNTILGLLFSPTLWGWSLLVVGCLGTVASLRERWLDAGYILVAMAIGVWAVALLLGSLISLATGTVDWQVGGKALGTALWFFFACRGLVAPLYRHGTVADFEVAARTEAE